MSVTRTHIVHTDSYCSPGLHSSDSIPYNRSRSLARDLVRVSRYFTSSALDPAQRNFLQKPSPPFADSACFQARYRLHFASSVCPSPNCFSTRLSLQSLYYVVRDVAESSFKVSASPRYSRCRQFCLSSPFTWYLRLFTLRSSSSWEPHHFVFPLPSSF